MLFCLISPRTYYRLTWVCGYASIPLYMKLMMHLVSLFEKEEAKTLADYQRELLVKTSAQQFTKLRELGLGIQISVT